MESVPPPIPYCFIPSREKQAITECTPVTLPGHLENSIRAVRIKWRPQACKGPHAGSRHHHMRNPPVNQLGTQSGFVISVVDTLTPDESAIPFQNLHVLVRDRFEV